MLGLTLSEFSEILTLVLQGGYFRFNDSYWLQQKGLGMGVKPAPPFAVIYVYCVIDLPLLERNFEHLYRIPPLPEEVLPKIISYHRYIDDCLQLLVSSLYISQLFQYINSFREDIQFTYEMSNNSLAFLDLQIYLNPETKTLDFGLFVKTSSKNIFVNYNSHHPRHLILNTAQNEYCRAIKNSSKEVLKN